MSLVLLLALRAGEGDDREERGRMREKRRSEIARLIRGPLALWSSMHGRRRGGLKKGEAFTNDISILSSLANPSLS